MEIYIFCFCLYKNVAFRPEVETMFCLAKDDENAQIKAKEICDENFTRDKYSYVHCVVEKQDKVILKGMLDSITATGTEEESEEWADSIG